MSNNEFGLGFSAIRFGSKYLSFVRLRLNVRSEKYSRWVLEQSWIFFWWSERNSRWGPKQIRVCLLFHLNLFSWKVLIVIISADEGKRNVNLSHIFLPCSDNSLCHLKAHIGRKWLFRVNMKLHMLCAEMFSNYFLEDGVRPTALGGLSGIWNVEMSAKSVIIYVLLRYIAGVLSLQIPTKTSKRVWLIIISLKGIWV